MSPGLTPADVSSSETSPTRNRLIDVLRGAAAIAVALFHFSEPYPALPDAWHRATKWGWLGVTVFFVVSGFCLAQARAKDAVIPFWGRRLLRIFPPYWASVVLVLGLIGLRVLTTGTNDIVGLPRNFSGWAYVASALTEPASKVPGLSLVYWSLGYELAFYLLLGLLGFRRTPLLLPLFSLVALFLPLFPFDRWGLFGLGVACSFLAGRRYAEGGVLALICLAANFIRLDWFTAVTGLVTAALILHPPRSVLHAVFLPLRAAGDISYSLYLTHATVSYLFFFYYSPWLPARQPGPAFIQEMLQFAACLLFAWLFHGLIEKPSHALARRLGNRAGPIPRPPLKPSS